MADLVIEKCHNCDGEGYFLPDRKLVRELKIEKHLIECRLCKGTGTITVLKK
jgi:hypothetical protein